MSVRIASVVVFVCALGCESKLTAPPDAAISLHRPVIDGDWWTVAGEPDLGALSAPFQEPVDFAVWQAADGTWQLQSCIRGTKEGGATRLFYRWEGRSLTDTSWTPVGIAMRADPSVGEPEGGMQAPYVFKQGGLFHMFYGDTVDICHATSVDGKAFTRVLVNGMAGMFGEGPDTGARDPMMLPVGDQFYTYYTAFIQNAGTDLVRTSRDLVTWSARTTVAVGGEAGLSGSAAECPFVVYRPDDQQYYLFRTQQYLTDPQTRVYRSPDPLDFGKNDDRYLIGVLPVAAPEIFEYAGQWYIASLLPSLTGIRIAKLRWDPEAAR